MMDDGRITVVVPSIIMIINYLDEAMSKITPMKYMPHLVGWPGWPCMRAPSRDKNSGDECPQDLKHMYYSQCSLVHREVNPVIGQYLQSLAKKGCRVLDWSQITTDDKDTQVCIEFLSHDTYFRELKFCIPDRPNALRYAAVVASKNESITSYCFAGTGCDDYVTTQFIDHLSFNRFCSNVVKLDLSGNSLSKGGVQSLAECLPKLRSLKHLIISNCGLDAQTIQIVLNALKDNVSTCKGLETLDISGNKLGDAGSLTANDWLFALYNALQNEDAEEESAETTNSLTSLLMASTAANLEYLNTLCKCRSLRMLDMSCVTVPETHVEMMEAFSWLSVLIARSCIYPQSTSIGTLLRSLYGVGRKLGGQTSVSVDLSGPYSGGGYVNEIATSINPDTAGCLNALILDKVTMTHDEFSSLVKALMSNPKNLRTLSISGPKAETVVGEENAWSNALVYAIKNLPSLRALAIANGYGPLVSTSVLRALCSSEGPRVALEELDVSNNNFDRSCIQALCHVLEKPDCRLRQVVTDNKLTTYGLQSISLAISNNTTLTTLGIQHDLKEERQRLNRMNRSESMIFSKTFMAMTWRLSANRGDDATDLASSCTSTNFVFSSEPLQSTQLRL